ncbi:HTH-type transcriptional regulator KipR [Microbacterium sp. Bi98]|uniref:IclR family transcriptional regulator n=1 Tax=unclassified Microbacterium TaxID=2609290 RepID=UPI0006F67E00|nr:MULTISPECIES: IclR family transcriptional regulator [unclassified Microbacterium]KRD54003.1 IclR family transcriptional regulator [Microbacterium sp. Root280D1]CAH0198001.1 HTH-type transcriptional regulator KipR [Microbacterium sp. Bi98]
MPPATSSVPSSSSMGRGLDVLSSVATLTRDLRPATVSVIADSLGRERSQVSRTLASLERSGLVTRAADRSFALAWGWYAAAQELSAQRLRTHGLVVLEDLSSHLGEAAFLSVLQGDTTLTMLESLPADSRMIGSWIGRAYPAYCSDAGRATLWDAPADEIRAVFRATEFSPQGPNTPTSIDDFLARLDDDRRRGFAIVDQEAEPGLYSVAAPVWDHRGEVVAAVQVIGTRDVMAERTATCGEACARAAAELSRELGAPSAVLA